jgi:hypothetical protein
MNILIYPIITLLLLLIMDKRESMPTIVVLSAVFAALAFTMLKIVPVLLIFILLPVCTLIFTCALSLYAIAILTDLSARPMTWVTSQLVTIATYLATCTFVTCSIPYLLVQRVAAAAVTVFNIARPRLRFIVQHAAPNPGPPAAAMFMQSQHNTRRNVNVDCKYDKTQYDAVHAIFPDTEFVPIPNAFHRDHAVMRTCRLMAIRGIDARLKMLEATGVLTADPRVHSVGSNISFTERHLSKYAARMTHSTPTVGPSDVHRHLDRADQKYTTVCRHTVAQCDCVLDRPPDISISVDVLYYLTPRDVAKLLRESSSGLHVAAMLNFDYYHEQFGTTSAPVSAAGTFVGESQWNLVWHKPVGSEKAELYVTMSAQSGTAPYFHPYQSWLNLTPRDGMCLPRAITVGGTSFVWEVMSNHGPFMVLQFALCDEAVVDRALPVPAPVRHVSTTNHALDRVPADLRYTNLRAPMLDAGKDCQTFASLSSGVVVATDHALLVGEINKPLRVYPSCLFVETEAHLSRRTLSADVDGKDTRYIDAANAVVQRVEIQYNVSKQLVTDFVTNIFPSLYHNYAHAKLPVLREAVNANRPIIGPSPAARYNRLLTGVPDYPAYHTVFRFLVLTAILMVVVVVLDLATSTWVTVTESAEYDRKVDLAGYGVTTVRCIDQVRRLAAPTLNPTSWFGASSIVQRQTVCTSPFQYGGDMSIPNRWPALNDGSTFRLSIESLAFVHSSTDALVSLTTHAITTIPSFLSYTLAAAPVLRESLLGGVSPVVVLIAAYFLGRNNRASLPFEYVCVGLLLACFAHPGILIVLCIILIAHSSIRTYYPHYTITSTIFRDLPLVRQRGNIDGATARVRVDPARWDEKTRVVARQDLRVNGCVPVIPASVGYNLYAAVRNRNVQYLPVHHDENGNAVPYDPPVMDAFQKFCTDEKNFTATTQGGAMTGGVRLLHNTLTIKPTDWGLWLARFPLHVQKKLREAKESLESNKITTREIMKRNMFTKTEILDMVDESEMHLAESCGTPRSIVTVSDYMKVLTGPFCHGASAMLKQAWTVESALVYGPGLHVDEVGAIFFRWSCADDNTLSCAASDCKRYDSTQNSKLLESEITFYRMASLVDVVAACDGTSPIDWLEKSACVKASNPDKGVFMAGTYMVGSGALNTTVGNTWRLLMILLFCICTVRGCNPGNFGPIATNPEHRGQVIGTGDDMEIFMLIPLTAAERQQIATIMTALGLQPKFEPPCTVAQSSFCSARPWYAEKNIGTEMQPNWVPTMVMGPKIGRVVPKMLTIVDPADAKLLQPQNTNPAVQRAALANVVNHYYRVAEAYLSIAPHVPIVAAFAQELYNQCLAHLNTVADVMLVPLKPTVHWVEHKTLTAPLKPIRASAASIAQAALVYGQEITQAEDILRPFRNGGLVQRILGVLPRRAQIAQLNRAIEIDLASLLPVRSFIISVLLVPVCEELLKQFFLFAIFIVVYEGVVYSFWNSLFHISTHFAPFWVRVVVHAMWNFLVLARESGLLARPGAAIDPLTFPCDSTRKNRKMINSKYMKKKGGPKASTKNPRSPATREGEATRNKTPEQLYAEKMHLTNLLESKQTERQNTKNPALIASLASAIASAANPAKPLKNIVGAKPAAVSTAPPHLIEGEHDMVNFPHSASIISKGMPVAISSSMTSEEVMAMADKRHVRHNGEDGVEVTMRCRMPVTNYNGNTNSTDVTTQTFKVNPADNGTFPLIAPAARIFDCWNADHTRFYARTETGTVLPSNGSSRVVMSADPEVTDLPPATKTAAESQAVSKAFAAWESKEIIIPQKYFKRTGYYYMDDGVVADGDERVTTPCQVYITVADTAGTAALIFGEVWVEAEFRFWSSTLSSQNSVAPPFRAIAGGTTNVGIVRAMYSTLDATSHASVTGATSTVVGSNPAFSITGGNGATSATGATFTILLPFVGTPSTGGRNRAGSYVILVAANCNPSINGNVLNLVATNCTAHTGPTFNGWSGTDSCSPTVGTPGVGSNADLMAYLRVDVPASTATFAYTNALQDAGTGQVRQWLAAPAVLVGINASSPDSITRISVYCFPVASTQPALLSTNVTSDGKTATYVTSSTVSAFDGRVRMCSTKTSTVAQMTNTSTVWLDKTTAISVPQSNLTIKVDSKDGSEFVVVPRPPSPTPSLATAAALKNYFAGSHIGALPVSAFVSAAKQMTGSATNPANK